MPIPNNTLHHLFPVPSECKRDFLRENKEYVREKSKLQQTRLNGKRSNLRGNSKECLNGGNSSISSMYLYTGVNRDTRPLYDTKPVYEETQQQYPQRLKHTNKKNQKNWSTTQNAASKKNSVESIAKVPQNSKSSSPLQRRQYSTVKVKNHVPKKTATIAIQTDEIQDEIFLYSALKKCASPAFKAALKAKYQQKDLLAKTSNSPEHQKIDNGQTAETTTTKENPHVAKEKQFETKQIEINTKRYGGGGETQKQFIKPQASETEYPLQLHARNSRKYYDTEQNLINVNNEISDHWNVMNFPIGLKKSCDPKKCINCPNGYHLLCDEERLQIKQKLLEHESLLIRQLNSFPLAIETLRVRQSKTRIEKELSILEQNLRKLTKKKVYAKLNE